MYFIRTIEKTSFKKLLGLSLVLAMALTIPIAVLLTQEQTKIKSSAYFEKPTLLSPTPIQYGTPSAGTPNITLVWPFLGKEGDTVLIYGTDFGNNPSDKSLTLGTQTIGEKDILHWTPDLIEFNIPNGLQDGSFESISLTVASQKTIWGHPFTIYSKNTQIQISKPNDHLYVINYPKEGKIIIDFEDGVKIENDLSTDIPLPEGKTILSLELRDANGTPLPFFVNPMEFGF